MLGGFQGSGGIGRVTSVLANSIAEKEGFNVTAVAYCQSDKPMIYRLSEKINSEYLYTSVMPMAKALVKHHAVSKLTEILKRRNIDIVIACGALYYPLGIAAAKKAKAKCFCWEHINPATTTDYRFQNLCRKLAVKKADKIIVLTKSAQQYYSKHFSVEEQRLAQIYNPVSQDASVSGKYDEKSRKIISVGRLSYQKNFELLIDVAAKVLPKHPDWSWDIYGGGEGADSLREKIKVCGLTDRVNLKGMVYDLYERYGSYSFQVMTSRYEGFPMSLIEGASNRLPLVSFDIETGPDEIINNGENGFLVESQNTQAMIQKIEELIEAPELRIRMSENAFDSVKRFDLAEITERWCEICLKSMK
ncbi:MAG: glycosyltransferase family 4 protein [Clostridiales bacterium]|nr:glycosyltransferase family 4 protein [Clostridiales bacterium]